MAQWLGFGNLYYGPEFVLAKVGKPTAAFASTSWRECETTLKSTELKFEDSKASEKACKNYNSNSI